MITVSSDDHEVGGFAEAWGREARAQKPSRALASGPRETPRPHPDKKLRVRVFKLSTTKDAEDAEDTEVNT